jgi:quercetin dioxygenase-like cupin family protein
MEQYRVDFESLSWNTSLAGVRSKVHKQGGKQLRLVEFSKEFVEPDWCTKGHIGCVLDGELEINFTGKFIIFKSGDGLFIPAGDEGKHMARALTDTATLLLVEDA